MHMDWTLIKNLVFLAGVWWRTPLIPALERQRQVDLCEFEDSQGYTDKTCLKKKKRKEKKEKFK